MSIWLIVCLAALVLAAVVIFAARAVNRAGSFRARTISAVLVLTGLGAGIASLIQTVPPGHVVVASLFGAVQQRVYGEGLHFVNPLYVFEQFSVRRTMFDFRGTGNQRGRAGEQIVAVSSDSTPLTVDVDFPLSLNAASGWQMYQRFGQQNVIAHQLIIPAARAAVRDAVATFTWRDAATVSRDRLAQRIEERFRALVVQDLTAAGFSEQEAGSTFTIQPVQLRKILPPAKVLNAVAEKIAAEEDLERQKTLTKIAEEVARRRQNEGRGVSNLFSELPKGFQPSQIREVLAAIADKTRAEAMMKAVETGQVSVIVMNGSQPAITVNGQK